MNTTQLLHGNWNLFRAEPDGSKTLLGEISIPGTVLSALLEKGMIADPYWRCEEYAAREIMAFDYIIERSFVVSSLDNVLPELVAYGLDTLTEIRLNGKTIAVTDDMHRTWRIPLDGKLNTGENLLSITFFSALNAARNEDENNDIFYASTGAIHGNAAIRKAHYMFGWDWGPQLPDAGIFRDILIEYQDSPSFCDCRIRQEHRENGVVIHLQTVIKETNADRIDADRTDKEAKTKREECRQPVLFNLQIKDPEGNTDCLTLPWAEEISYTIKAPKLWWPNGLGPHPLYHLTLNLTSLSGEIYDSKSFRIGLRTITVCTDPHEYGNEFALTVNGVKLFAMGANLIPEDNFLTRITPERTRKLVSDCARANFNCIRVWGGGYYPDNTFYDCCDEEGILIWQDLMFACNVYRLDDRFEENIVEETKDNVRRLRHHACLALWCGNNEMEWGWGDEWARIRGHHPRYKADYIKIFEYILPKALKSCDDTTFYWPSSPSSGGSYDEPNAVNRGDQHYWEVWHSGKPFTEYRKNYFSFCSEYGFQSFPGRKTIEQFTIPKDRNIFSRVMESHQKNGTANGKILGYIADYFLYPDSLDSLTYISQILQLKAIQYGVEHWRRNRGRCMGSLYWQLNDCWPVASWASIDYYGRWKALHYGARRFYAPIMISASEKEELSPEITYYIHNDTRKPFTGTVETSLILADFRVLSQQTKEIQAEPLSACPVFSVNYTSWLTGWEEKTHGFVRVRLFEGGQCISEQTTLFVKPKHFSYPKVTYQVRAEEEEKQFAVTITADGFAQYVELDFEEWDAVFSDNYFDITEKEGKTVKVEKAELPLGTSAEEILGQIKVRSVADSYSVN